MNRCRKENAPLVPENMIDVAPPCGGLKAPAPQKAQEEVQWLQQIQPPIWAEQHKELGIE